MPSLWSMSTTVRNSNRIRSFMIVLQQLNGRAWNVQTQREYQILLIQYRMYHPKVWHQFMANPALTFNEAEAIFDAQNYVDPPMRGRQSMNPLKKLGLVEIDLGGRINITQSGWNVINGTLGLEAPMLDWAFVDFGANIKPYVATLRFINEVDLIEGSGNGISYEEFGYFVMTIYHYTQIANQVQLLIQSRNNNIVRDNHKNHIQQAYENFYNFNDYLDNNIRYLRQSDLLDIQGDRIRLNYNRIADITNIIINDNASV
ncbi:AlwI family type II restriction endonuclease [Clostridium beijerinckii]|uniref:AlwI family type II restriction endonuclease n=1 Tax=Clostridium beijerinckii TaxID=1520 RepID=UPI0023312B13|nr:AlwI family type II restriction endonuclease [Clostridium beijerinckii]